MYTTIHASDEQSQHELCFKRTWTPKEDAGIIRLVEEHGASNWSLIASHLVARSGKQCRERYHNHLQPDVKKGGWTEEEDRLIVELQAKYGNQWAKITKELPGRTDNAVKNRWHAAMRSQSRIPELKMGKPAKSSLASSLLKKIPMLPIGKSVPTNNSESGNLSARCQMPSAIEDFVRKYSPRFEVEMRLSDNIDLNMISHGHQMYQHIQLTARSDKTCENTPRFTPRLTPRVRGADSNGCQPHALLSLTIQIAAPSMSLSEEDILDLCELVNENDNGFDAQVPVVPGLAQVPSMVTEEYLNVWAQYDVLGSNNNTSDQSDLFMSNDLTDDEDNEFYLLSDSEDSLMEEVDVKLPYTNSQGRYPSKASPRTRSNVYSSLGMRANKLKSNSSSTKSKRCLDTEATVYNHNNKRSKSMQSVDEWSMDMSYDDFCY